MTLFNCRVGSFCDILLAFSASPHHIKLTYSRINCLNTHFLSDNCRQNYFDFPKKQDCGVRTDESSAERAGLRADREGSGSRQLSWLFHCLKNVIIVLGFYKHTASVPRTHSRHRAQDDPSGSMLNGETGDKANNCTEVCLERNYLLIIPGCLAMT